VSPIVIRLGRLGDTILLSGLLGLLHERFGKPCRLVGASPWCKQLYQGHPDVDRVWSFDRHSPLLFGLDWWRALSALRDPAWAPVYVCEPEPRQLARVRRLIGLSGIDPRRCLFLTDEREPPAHWIDRLNQFGERTPATLRAAADGSSQGGAEHIPMLQILASDRRDRDAWLTSQGWHGRKLLLVQPGSHDATRHRSRVAATDSKAWPLDRWAALLQRVHADVPEALILLSGARDEAAMLEQVRAATGLPMVVAATPPVRRLLALCEIAYAMIAVDSGAAHAAAAMSLPVLVLFGSHTQSQWLPRSHPGAAVVGVGGPPQSSRADELSVDTVFDAWLRLRVAMRAAGAESGTDE
jgi:ADP-heptose:LPS heptosyltransferase